LAASPRPTRWRAPRLHICASSIICSQNGQPLRPLAAPPLRRRGYQGDKLRDAIAEFGNWTLDIIKRLDAVRGFVVLPRRWAVEPTFAWLGRCRRLAKDFKATIESAVEWVFAAGIRLPSRGLARA
jgi:transposase